MRPPSSASGACRQSATEDGCITCGDVAVELTVDLVDTERGLALCSDAVKRRESVEIALVGPVRTGDRLLVHAGTAISHLGPTSNPADPGRAAEEVGRL
jgi:hydrogenase maturation factor